MIVPYNGNGYFMLYPFLPPNCSKPPTVYSILNSIVNGDKEEENYSKIKDLSKLGRNKIFDFDYPLTENITKEKFETMILNHFLQRRIGFDTVLAFKIQLDVKLNEIMPLYNKMFDAIENWEIFNDGEITTRDGKDNKKSESKNNTTNSVENKSNTSVENISDRRNSELPQNQLSELRDGNYVTNYNYDKDTNTGEDTSESKGTSESINNSTDENTYIETIRRSPADKIAILKELQENVKSIYSMIFKDLECLFYQII